MNTSKTKTVFFIAAMFVAIVFLCVPVFAKKQNVGLSGTMFTGLTLEQFVAGIAERADGLIFISETDSEVVSWYRTRPAEDLTIAEFRRVARLPQLIEIETQTYSDFFTRLINGSQGAQWEILRDYLVENTTEQMVFRVQQPAPFDNYFNIYAVGLFDGKIVGIHVVSLET